jgi:hypothetical protein
MRLYLAKTCQDAPELLVRAGPSLYLNDLNLLKF